MSKSPSLIKLKHKVHLHQTNGRTIAHMFLNLDVNVAHPITNHILRFTVSKHSHKVHVT